MRQFLSIILIGIALSMDTFSLSLSLGMFNVDNHKSLKLALIVGAMHFAMPFLGMILGSQLIRVFELNFDIVLGIVLIFIAIQMIVDVIKHEEENFNLNLLGMFLFAFGVSLDSFTVGLGIKAITEKIYFAMIIFAICSFIFTFLGLVIGRQANKCLGNYANIIGATILLALGIGHLI